MCLPSRSFSKFEQIEDEEIPEHFSIPTTALLVTINSSRPSSPESMPELETRPASPETDEEFDQFMGIPLTPINLNPFPLRPISPENIPEVESRPESPELNHTTTTYNNYIRHLLANTPGTVDIHPETLRYEIIVAGYYRENFVRNVQRVLQANLPDDDRCMLINLVMRLFDGH